MRNPVVLAIVNGAFQATSLLAALRELGLPPGAVDLRVILVDMLPQSLLHQVTRRILEAAGVQRMWLLAPSTKVQAFPAALADAERALELRMQELTTLAVYGVHRPVARFFANRAPQAKLLIYEDGTRAYLGAPPALRRYLHAFRDQGARLLGSAFADAFREPRHEAREVSYALLLSDLLAPPPDVLLSTLVRVRSESLRKVMQACTPRVKRMQLERPFILLIGQYYARLKQLSEQEELALYRKATARIVERGLIPVWRGHIREEDRLFATLKQTFPTLRSFDELVDEPGFPLEFYAALFEGPCAGAVSFSSSALFYLKQLYQLPTYTMVDERLVASMNHPHRDGCKLALDNLPNFFSG